MPFLRRAKYFTENVFDKSIGRFLFLFVEKKKDLFQWHYNCLVRQHVSIFKDFSPKYHYYEFGVASGYSIENYIMALKKFCKDYKFDIGKFHIHGFDSFAGLPDRENSSDNHPQWHKGEMSWEEGVVRAKAAALGFPLENLHLYKGFYEDTLTPELAEKLKETPPALINIDCDYYSSTSTALKWLAPFLGSGAIFRFDDYWAFHGNPEYGEIRAINELNESGIGYLTSFPILGLETQCFIFSRKRFEYGENK
jgi:hypothetical protein